MKQLIFSISFLAFAAAFAAPQIVVDRVQQRYPWNGLVDIDYTVSGIEATHDANDYFVSIAVVTGATTVVCSNFLTYAGCDLPSANGSHRVTWDTAADGYEALVASGSVKATLTYDVGTLSDSTYMVVDLSAGTAGPYPVRFIRTDLPTSVFNRALYKTARLVLKRVPKGGMWLGTGADGYGNVTAKDTANAHYTELTHDYYLGIFPVTIGQFYRVNGWSQDLHCTDASSQHPQAYLSGWFKNENILGTTFFSRMAANAVSRGRSLDGFTLPTEAQWEYACRAGDLHTFFYGNNNQNYNNLNSYAWNYGNKGERGPGCESGQGTRWVGTKLANPWGFYDVYGNVFEWCMDWKADYPAGVYDESNPLRDPTGPATRGDAGRVARGGNWEYGWNFCCSGGRAYGTDPSSNNNGRWGFRLSLTVK